MSLQLSEIKKVILRLARADMVFYLMPVLIVLLIVGTLAQEKMGLYAAHQMFFASFIIWAGPIPLPGGYTVLSILSVNLLLKFLFSSEWTWSKSGIILSHLGALILLIGGLLTAMSAQESYMLIPEGQQTPYIYDYHDRELLIYVDDNLKAAIPLGALQVDEALPISLPFKTRITGVCASCEILRREESSDFKADLSYQSLAQFMALSMTKPSKEPEADIAGITFYVDDAPDAQNGVYIAFEAMPKPVQINVDDRLYRIVMGKKQRVLPFQIRLVDFEKQSYAGIDMARNYASDIMIIDGLSEWPTRIEMNEPLRYRGYTFFQSAFEQTPDGEMTILSVVQNQGWLFPYMGTGILAFGLLLHLILVMKRRQGL